jgi:hypothetical protein
MVLQRKSAQWTVGLVYHDWIGRDRVRAGLQQTPGGGIRITSIEEAR